MIDYLIGVDGGGTGTRVRLARFSPDGAVELAQGASGPSGLGLGIARAWASVQDAVAHAFAAAGIEPPSLDRMAIGLGLAGVHNRQWAQAFVDADPGYAALRLETDAFTTLMGAHGGSAGAIVAIGTGSVGEVLQPGRLGLPRRRRSERRLDRPCRHQPHRTGARRAPARQRVRRRRH